MPYNRTGVCRYTTLLSLLLWGLSAQGQDTLHARFGAYLGDNLNFHFAHYVSLPGAIDCPCDSNKSGFGMGLHAGILYEMPLKPRVQLSLRAGVNWLSGTLSTVEPTTLGTGDGGTTDGEFTHTVDASILAFSFEPAIRFSVARDFFLHGGLQFGVLSTHAFSQQEEITTPANGGTFIDTNGDTHSRIRNKVSGAIPNPAGLDVGFVLGASYEFPLNRKAIWLAVPEVSLVLPFNDMAPDLNWSITTISIGVAVKYAPKPYVPPPFQYDTIYRRDTVEQILPDIAAARTVLVESNVKEEHTETDDARMITTVFEEHYEHQIPPPPKPKLRASIVAVGVEKDGKETPVVQMRIEEFMGEQFHPMLPFVFFESGSATLPSRYQQLTKEGATDFTEKRMYDQSTLVAHVNVLNIIGRRMRDRPKASLVLTGCSDGEEANGADVAKRRAETVKSYLTDAWGIEASRVVAKSRGLPELPSNPKAIDGMEENRRVEIVASDPSVLDIVEAHDTLRTANPPSIRLKPSVLSDTGLQTWSINARQHGHTWKTFEGTGAAPKELTWKLAEDQKNVPRFDAPMEVEFVVRDKADQVENAAASLPMEQLTVQKKHDNRVQDKAIDSYDLLLFDYSKATLGTANQRTINMIRSRLAPNSVVHMQGFTDRTGNDVYNRKLATERAKNVQEALGHKYATFDGIGSTEAMYPNNIPEGRMYSRTVQVTVETPIK